LFFYKCLIISDWCDLSSTRPPGWETLVYDTHEFSAWPSLRGSNIWDRPLSLMFTRLGMTYEHGQEEISRLVSGRQHILADVSKIIEDLISKYGKLFTPPAPSDTKKLKDDDLSPLPPLRKLPTSTRPQQCCS